MDDADGTKEDPPVPIIHDTVQEPQVTFAQAFTTSRPPIIPESEIQSLHNMCPGKTGARILRLSPSKVLKYGPVVNLSEANAMCLLSGRFPDISIPRVHNAYKIGEVGYIIMDYIPGPTLMRCWASLSVEDRESVYSQLKRYISSWRQIQGTFYGTVEGGPCPDSIFCHEFYPPRKSYGPFHSRHDFNEGVVLALRNSRPNPSQYNLPLETRIRDWRDEEIIFTHGDLGLGNIIFHEGKVTVIDWGAAGFSVKEKEFIETKLRTSRYKEWGQFISSCFPNFEPQYDFWTLVANEMRLYSGI